MNPLMGLIGGMGGNNPMTAMAQAINVINQIKQNGNPQAAINAMAQQNPNVKKAMEMCQGKIHSRYLNRCADKTALIRRSLPG